MSEMSDKTASRHAVYEQIRAKELARGATEDEAARVAAETVDKVIAAETQDGE